MLSYCSGPPTDDSACEVKKHGNHLVRNNSGSVPTALCGGKCTESWTPILLYAQELHLFESKKNNVCHMPPDNHKQLETFIKLSNNPKPTKKRNLVDIITSMP